MTSKGKQASDHSVGNTQEAVEFPVDLHSSWAGDECLRHRRLRAILLLQKCIQRTGPAADAAFAWVIVFSLDAPVHRASRIDRHEEVRGSP